MSVKLDTFFPIILGGTEGFVLPSIAELGTLVTGGLFFHTFTNGSD